MPICTVHLLALDPRTQLSEFLALLSKQDPQPLVTSRAIRWMIRPESIQLHPLLSHQWDLLLIFQGQHDGLPTALRPHTHASYTVHTGVPSSLTKNFAATNQKLLHPSADAVHALTGALNNPRFSADSQSLAMSPELYAWIKGYDPQGTRGAVSMLNLLAFKEGMHSEYLKYGKAFAETIGSRRGGVAKVVGRVTGGDDGATKWDEVALAHYPSIWHFADMAASDDYQEVNLKHRVPSLKDTCILFTSELELPGRHGPNAKL